MLLCVGILTGCDETDKEVFGNTGMYLLEAGRDIFRQGFSNVFGNSELNEPQSNEIAEILYDYNVKDIESAPKTEKSEYDYSGPENDGIPVVSEEMETPVDSSIDTGSTEDSGTSDVGAVIVLSSGHSNNGNPNLECIRLVSYGIAAVDLVMQFRDSKETDVKSFKISKLGKNKELAKNICGNKNGSVTRNELIKRFIELGIIRTAEKDSSNGDYGLNQKFTFTFQKGKKIQYDKFYRESGKKFDKNILSLVNDGGYAALETWAKNRKWSSGQPSGTWSESGLVLFKAMATSGGVSHKGNIDEYQINFATTKRLQKLLEKDGYSVVLTRSQQEATKLDNGSDFSNRNMSLFAAEQEGAVLHFMIHWDSGSGSGMHCLTGAEDIVGGKAAEIAEEVSKVIEDTSGKIEVYKGTGSETEKVNRGEVVTTVSSLHNTRAYTGINWQAIPTIEFECGYMDKGGDIEKYIKDGKFYADKFWKGRYEMVKEGIDKAIEESGLSKTVSSTSTNSSSISVTFKTRNSGKDIQATSKTTFSDLNHGDKPEDMKERFTHFIELFKKCKEVYGVPVSVSIAQFIEESQAGVAGGPAQQGNNGFGFKKGGSKKKGSPWDGKSVYVADDGTKYRKYESMEDSIIDHAVLLARGDSYALAREQKSVEDFIDVFANTYCPGGEYAGKLRAHIKKYDLTQYDN